MFFSCFKFIFKTRKLNKISCKCSNCKYKKQTTVDNLPEYFPPFPHSFN